MSPFRIDGPAVINFSGGRTSGYMLWRILEECGGVPPQTHVVFCNTGEEHPKTLDFVDEVARRWSVKIHWLEFRKRLRRYKVGDHDIYQVAIAEVDHATASRNGEPFDLMVDEVKYLPNPVMRFCTSYMKLWTTVTWLDLVAGYGLDTTHIIGIRADEPSRVAKRRAQSQTNPPPWDTAMPLVEAETTRANVLDFWKAQPFDLEIPPGHGNCVLCFEKGAANLKYLVPLNPEQTARMIAREERRDSVFLKGLPFASLKRQRTLDLVPADVEINCSCTD